MGPPNRLARLRELAQRRLGINLDRAGLDGALMRFVEQSRCPPALGLAPSDELKSAAFQALVDAVTVQHSWLFRDHHQLEVACSLLRTPDGEDRVRRVWVPACATGEDVYSLIALSDALGLSVEVLGTDVNAGAVRSASRGCYRAASTRQVPAQFRHVLTGIDNERRVIARHRRQACFAVHNLLDEPPRSSYPSGKWDLVVCRNVLIYFTQEHAWSALTHLRDALPPGGVLVLGASDILTDLPPGLAPHQVGGRLVFRRVTEEAAGHPLHVYPTLERTPTTPIPPAHRRPLPPESFPPLPSWRPPEEEEPLAEPTQEEDAGGALEHLTAGIDLYLAGDLLEAVRELRTALFLRPRLWPAWYYLAVSNENLGRVEEARRAYAQVCEQIEVDEPLPDVAGHDFDFLRRDVGEIARRRAADQKR